MKPKEVRETLLFFSGILAGVALGRVLPWSIQRPLLDMSIPASGAIIAIVAVLVAYLATKA